MTFIDTSLLMHMSNYLQFKHSSIIEHVVSKHSLHYTLLNVSLNNTSVKISIPENHKGSFTNSKYKRSAT